MIDLGKFRTLAAAARKRNRDFFNRIKNKPPRNLDLLFSEAHEEVFSTTNCLTCANCCKTTSPIFYNRDIDRASKGLKLRPGAFAEKYLKVDEDEDYVLKTSPCPFLLSDNRCSIYDHRPDACREYPHTNRKNMRELTELTFKNTMVCPAVLSITEKLEKLIEKQ